MGPLTFTRSSVSDNGNRRHDRRSDDEYSRSDRRGYSHYAEEKRYRRDDPPRRRHRDDDYDRYSYYGRGSGRSDSDRRGGCSRGRRDEKMDWKCLECDEWNYPEEYRCARCGTKDRSYYRDQDPHDRHDDRKRRKEDEFMSRPRRTVEEDIADGEDTDEFGRKKKAKKELPTKKPREWPPCFDTAGSEFVFDTRSGMFYEAESDFFYDPKTKLYFGNKQGAYYSYNSDEKPPFKEIQKVSSVSPEEQDRGATISPVVNNNNSLSSTTGGKPSFAIKLKTKALSKKSKESKEKKILETKNKPQQPPSNSLQKKHEADMSKWSERQEEKQQEENNSSSKNPSIQSLASSQLQQKVTKTAKGEPICLLCRRKFATLEKLQYHERASALHKENLSKKKAEEEKAAVGAAAKTKADASNYVDRAQQRRLLYGPETSLGAATSPSLVTMTSVDSAHSESKPAPVVVRPSDSLGETNIGNKLLQKQGWKNGEVLGRAGRDDPLPQQDSSIVREWERIESLAASGGEQRSGRLGGCGIGS